MAGQPEARAPPLHTSRLRVWWEPSASTALPSSPASLPRKVDQNCSCLHPQQVVVTDDVLRCLEIIGRSVSAEVAVLTTSLKRTPQKKELTAESKRSQAAATAAAFSRAAERLNLDYAGETSHAIWASTALLCCVGWPEPS